MHQRNQFALNRTDAFHIIAISSCHWVILPLVNMLGVTIPFSFEMQDASTTYSNPIEDINLK